MEPTVSAVLLTTMEHVHISMSEHTAEIRLNWIVDQDKPDPVWSGPLVDLGPALLRLSQRLSAPEVAFAE